jgi:uncharacterized membrane protein
VILLASAGAGAQTIESYRVTAVSKPVAGSNTKLVTCEAHFPAPPKAVWKLLNGFSDYPSFLPRVLAAESLGTSDNRERVYALLDIPWPLPDLWMILVMTRDVPSRLMSWQMADGNIKKNSGTLRVEKEDAGSVVRLEVNVDVGMGLPKWLVAWGTRHFLPKVAVAIGNRLLAGKNAVP